MAKTITLPFTALLVLPPNDDDEDDEDTSRRRRLPAPALIVAEYNLIH
jgi:hypothetical protein